MNTTVITAPASSGGMYASAKRFAGAASNDNCSRRALRAMLTIAITLATTASPSHHSVQCHGLSVREAAAAVPIALIPMATPPQPGMAVNRPARVIASRMNCRLSIAWPCSVGSLSMKSFIAQRRGQDGREGQDGRRDDHDAELLAAPQLRVRVLARRRPLRPWFVESAGWQ